MQMSHRPVIAVAAAVCLSITLGACGGDKDKGSTSSSSSSSSAKAAPKLKPRKVPDATPGSANPTIADYITQQKIQETPIHRTDAGAPKVEIQFPDGWQNAGDDTPDYAYGAIVYTGPGAENLAYTPNIIALVSRLDGPVDPDKLMSLAGGEAKNLPGFSSAGEEPGTSAGFPAFRIAGTYDMQSGKAAFGQETVVFKGNDGLYVLQMNATSDEAQGQELFQALDSIDKSLAITP